MIFAYFILSSELQNAEYNSQNNISAYYGIEDFTKSLKESKRFESHKT